VIDVAIVASLYVVAVVLTAAADEERLIARWIGRRIF